VGGLARREALTDVAEAYGATPAEVTLAWLLGLSPLVVPIPGGRRPETARSAARAATLKLRAKDHAVLDRALGRARPRPRARTRPDGGAEVVVVMGVPGAGKSRIAAEYAARGYVRLNRDERGGTLRALADALEQQLSARTQRVVLDNTYLTRAARNDVIEAAGRHGASVRCVWLDTPLAQAQVNLVERLLDRFGSLPTPTALRGQGQHEPGLLAPTSQMRAFRELEPPSADEGWADVERVVFEREPTDGGRPGIFVAAAALAQERWDRALEHGDRDLPHLVFHWSPDGSESILVDAAARLAKEVSAPVERALCPHPAGPPRCWCRPPLPGLPLAFARAHDVDPAKSTLIGSGPAHRTLAAALGARYLEV
jgi:hypothetical protein